MSIAPLRTTSPVARQSDEDNHFTCCEDDDLALCGADMTGVRVMAPDESITCTHCLRLDAEDVSDDDYCSVCPLDVLEQLP